MNSNSIPRYIPNIKAYTCLLKDMYKDVYYSSIQAIKPCTNPNTHLQ